MTVSFTERELDVMAVLWKNGSGTVEEVRDALSEDFARTTVLTVLRTLEEKGHVSHTAEGKAHRYVPMVKPDVAGKSALQRILTTMFDGSPELLLTQLVSDRRVDRHELEKLRAVLDEHASQHRRRKHK